MDSEIALVTPSRLCTSVCHALSDSSYSVKASPHVPGLQTTIVQMADSPDDFFSL